MTRRTERCRGDLAYDFFRFVSGSLRLSDFALSRNLALITVLAFRNGSCVFSRESRRSLTANHVNNRPMKFPLNLGLAVGATVALSILPASAQKNPLREAYFGETHIHTSWSFDAYVFGNTKTGPEEAYKFAMGEPIEHPAGYQIKITRPLDFMAVTDHAEYVGTMRLANDPDSPISKLPIAEKLKVKDTEDINRVYLFLGSSILRNKPIKELLSPDVAGTVWKQVIAIADKYYQPGKFTTFVAYEWTIDAAEPEHAS